MRTVPPEACRSSAGELAGCAAAMQAVKSSDVIRQVIFIIYLWLSKFEDALPGGNVHHHSIDDAGPDIGLVVSTPDFIRAVKFPKVVILFKHADHSGGHTIHQFLCFL